MPGAVAVRRACDQWRATTVLPLAEALLSHAAIVREANVLCMQLGLHIRVQLGVQRPGPAGDVHSCHDGVLAHSERLPALPQAIVRVMDMDACTMYVWSLEHLRQQVTILQRLRRWGAERAHDIHVRTELLGLATGPHYVAVATVYVPWHEGQWTEVPLRAHHGVPCTASCRVQVHTLASHRACRVLVDELVWDEALATELHWQVTLEGQRYATQPVHLVLHPTTEVRYQRTLVVPPNRAWPQGIHLTLFARPTSAYLAQLEAQDQAVERAVHAQGTDLALVGAAPVHRATRVHERYRRWASSFGVLARVFVTEARHGAMRLARVQRTQPPTWTVARGAPVLLSVLLQCESLEGANVHLDKVSMGDVCTVDAHGACYTHDTRYLVLQRLPSPPVKGAWRVDALWQPHAHDHVPPVQAGRFVRATLRVLLTSSTMPPVLCALPVWFRWHTWPTTAPPSWTPLAPPAHTVDHLFRVTLAPQPVRSPHELWHVDTRDVQVPGGEALRTWHVRGLSLVRDVLLDHAYERHVEDQVRRGAYPPAPAVAPASLHVVRTCYLPSYERTGRPGRPPPLRRGSHRWRVWSPACGRCAAGST